MANVAAHKTVDAPFRNEKEIIRVIYDFAVDGGATSALNLMTAGVDPLIVTGYHAVVKTTCTSGASAVLDVGIAGGDTDLLSDAIAVATLAANYVLQPEAVETEGTPNVVVNACPFRLAAGASIAQTIGTATFTAGKIEYVFEVMRA